MRGFKFLVKSFFPKWLLRKIRNLYYEIKGRKNERYYIGDTVFCPCCKKKFSSFINFVITKNNNNERYINTYKNTICPYCFSYPRHRIACYYFEKNMHIVPKKNILMFGAERSIKKWFDLNNCNYQTADLFDRSSDLKIDVQNIPFPDKSLELIICNHVLEHVHDYKIALQELKRVLTKNGLLEITVPTDKNFITVYEGSNFTKEAERIKHFGQHDHLRIFGYDFEKILKESGFLVEVVDGSVLPVEIGGIIGPANYDDNKVYICRNGEKGED